MNYKQGTPEWLEERKKYIGGSDAAGVLNMSDYGNSQYSVYHIKKGNFKIPENDAMRQGSALENFIFRRMPEEYKEPIKIKRMENLIVAENGFQAASLDGMTEDEQTIIEIKKVNDYTVKKIGNSKNPEIITDHFWQGVHYMSVTGAKKVIYAYVNSDQIVWEFQEKYGLFYPKIEQIYFRILERDEKLIDYLNKIEFDFWHNYFLKDIEPPITGSPLDSDILYEQNPSGIGEIDIDYDLCTEYEDISHNIKVLESKKSEISNKIKQAIGDKKTGIAGGYKVHWMRVEKKKVDMKAIEKKYPELIGNYTTYDNVDMGIRLYNKE